MLSGCCESGPLTQDDSLRTEPTDSISGTVQASSVLAPSSRTTHSSTHLIPGFHPREDNWPRCEAHR
jgi:hypothetical protein